MSEEKNNQSSLNDYMQSNMKINNIGNILTQYNKKPDLLANPNTENNILNSEKKIEKEEDNNINDFYNEPISNKKTIIIMLISIIILSFVVIFFVVIGSSKSLNCTLNEESSGQKMTLETKFKFKKEQIKKAEIIMTIDLGTLGDYKDEYIKSLEDSYNNKKDTVDVKITSKDAEVYVEMEVNKDKFDTINIIKKQNYKEIKKGLEKVGFICE